MTFSWEHSLADSVQCEGYTRDISSSGVFVLTKERLLSGTGVKLEVRLPSRRGTRSGASLRTQGRVVRSEETGFAAVADMGFRMRFPETSSPEKAFGTDSSNGGSQHEASDEETSQKQFDVIRRFWM